MLEIAFGLYVLLSATILVLRYRRSPKEGLLRLVLVLVFPIVGWLFPVFWPDRLYSKSQEEFGDYVTRQQEEHKVRQAQVYAGVETEKELSVIPIEDALLISEHHTRRRVIIDVLKQDAINYLEILQIAVGNEDTETSHYAVSAIMEVKRKLLLSLQDLSVQYENNKTDEYLLRTYADVLNGFMRSGFLDERTLLKYRYTYWDVLNHLKGFLAHSEWAYQEKIDLELILGMFTEAESTAKEFLENYPFSEEGYLCLMEVHFTTKSSDKFYQVLEELKKTPLRLSNHALMVVRFWSEGAIHA
jgi:hypothetical protein